MRNAPRAENDFLPKYSGGPDHVCTLVSEARAQRDCVPNKGGKCLGPGRRETAFIFFTSSQLSGSSWAGLPNQCTSHLQECK